MAFGVGNYGYKDGKGGDKHKCGQIDEFNADFRSMEAWFRNDKNAVALSNMARLAIYAAGLNSMSPAVLAKCTNIHGRCAWQEPSRL